MSDERGYQVLDYVEFLESKFAERANTANPFARFTEAVEDKLRAGRVSAGAIAETMSLLNKAGSVLSGAMAAGKSVADGAMAAGKSVAEDLVNVAQSATPRPASGPQTAPPSSAPKPPPAAPPPASPPTGDSK